MAPPGATAGLHISDSYRNSDVPAQPSSYEVAQGAPNADSSKRERERGTPVEARHSLCGELDSHSFHLRFAANTGLGGLSVDWDAPSRGFVAFVA